MRYHEQRRRNESQNGDWQRKRRDSQGREYFQDRREREDSRGRPYFKRYYRDDFKNPGDFLRERRSYSSGYRRDESRGGYRSDSGRRGSSGGEYRRDGYRSKSRERSNEGSEEKLKCIACRCKSCKKRKEKLEEIKVNLCEVGEHVVNYAEGDGKVVILDIGAPVSLVGKGWVERYLKENELSREQM